MPIFEYQCECGLKFETLVRNREDVHCLSCNRLLNPLPSRFTTRQSAIHTSERPVVFRNPKTGELRFPATREQPMDPKYAAQGYVREEAFSTFADRDHFE